MFPFRETMKLKYSNYSYARNNYGISHSSQHQEGAQQTWTTLTSSGKAI